MTVGHSLSRVMLALKSVMAKLTTLPTMIFDEIDTGVSGKIADKMGTMIGEMGENMQIFSITHLPQIASKKGAHSSTRCALSLIKGTGRFRRWL